MWQQVIDDREVVAGIAAITWPLPNRRSCDKEGFKTVLNDEVVMTSQATSLQLQDSEMVFINKIWTDGVQY